VDSRPSAGGSIKLWQIETDYQIFALAALDKIPVGFAGVCVLLRKTSGLGRVVIFIFSYAPAVSASASIRRLIEHKDFSYFSINEAALRTFENEEHAIAERGRLHLSYRPMVNRSLHV